MTAAVPVAGTRPQPDAPDPRTILLATDLEGASEGAADEAIRLSARLGARLLVVSVIDPGQLRRPGGAFRSRVDQVRDARERVAARIVARGRQAGVPVRFLVWEGQVGESILDAAAAERADLIVVGTHARGRLGRILLGSVSEFLIRRAPVPVLVVRQDGAAG